MIQERLKLCTSFEITKENTQTFVLQSQNYKEVVPLVIVNTFIFSKISESNIPLNI